MDTPEPHHAARQAGLDPRAARILLLKNVLANYVGTGAVAIAPILALPWYLAHLGPALFGLIGFITMLQTVLGLLDAGASQAFIREVVIRLGTANGKLRNASLLFDYERIYWIFALCVGGFTLSLGNTIAMHWLNPEGLSIADGRIAVWGAAAIFTVQFPGFLYRSVLVGTQTQVLLNCLMTVGAVARHGGGVIVVCLWPTLSAYVIWNASIALLETSARGMTAWASIGTKRRHAKWDRGELRSSWKMVGSMSASACLGALTVQMDKIVLSKIANMVQFAHYVAAATIALAVLQIIYPIIQAILPHAVHLRANPAALYRLCVRLSSVIALGAGLVGVLFFLVGRDLLTIWLRDSSFADHVYPLLAVLLIGTCLNAFFNIGYIYWLTQAKIRRIVQVNALSLVLSIVITPFLVLWLGTIGAAFGWLVINLIGFLISTEWLALPRVAEQN